MDPTGDELGFRLPLPWLRWPGSLIGSRKLAELGLVEFMSADMAHMLLVPRRKVLAIHPRIPAAFMMLFQQY